MAVVAGCCHVYGLATKEKCDTQFASKLHSDDHVCNVDHIMHTTVLMKKASVFKCVASVDKH